MTTAKALALKSTTLIKKSSFPQFEIIAGCLACNACVALAPSCFKILEEEPCSVIFKQPESDAEVIACDNAAKACPVSIIKRQ